MMLSGFGEEPETEKIDEDELRDELSKKRAEKKKKFVLLSNLDENEPQQEESRPEEKRRSPRSSPKRRKSAPRKRRSNTKSPNSAGAYITALKTRPRSSRPRP